MTQAIQARCQACAIEFSMPADTAWSTGVCPQCGAGFRQLLKIAAPAGGGLTRAQVLMGKKEEAPPQRRKPAPAPAPVSHAPEPSLSAPTMQMQPYGIGESHAKYTNPLPLGIVLAVFACMLGLEFVGLAGKHFTIAASYSTASSPVTGWFVSTFGNGLSKFYSLPMLAILILCATVVYFIWYFLAARSAIALNAYFRDISPMRATLLQMIPLAHYYFAPRMQTTLFDASRNLRDEESTQGCVAIVVMWVIGAIAMIGNIATNFITDSATRFTLRVVFACMNAFSAVLFAFFVIATSIGIHRARQDTLSYTQSGT